MSVSGAIRRTLFWGKDILFNSSKMYNAYREIKKVNSDKTDVTLQIVQNSLNNLLKHASSTTQFYSEYKGKELCEFPVINKQTVIENRKEMFSSAYKGKKIHEMHTSGSTGIPFTIQQNMQKRMRVIAEIKAMNDLAGYPSHEKMLYILGAARNSGGGYSKKQEFCENIYRIGVAVNDYTSMKKITDFIINKKPTAIHASASNLPPLIEYIKNNNISPDKLSVKTIITGGEMVPEKLRQDLQDVFGEKCKIAVKYSNEEMGIFAQDNGAETPYVLNVADYHFEILKMDSDEPCEMNELGRIVVTDLYNYAVPLIRYDTGDIGALRQEDTGKWPVLVNLSGKRRDLLYNTKGESISGAAVTNMLKYVKNVRSWQIIQETECKYIYKIVPEENIPDEQDLLIPDLKELFGADAEIKIEFEEDIPTICSGKRRYTVNLYRPQ